MAARIKIEPYKPLDVHTPPVPGGGYIQVDASAGNFGLSPLAQLGLQAAEGVAAIATEAAQHLARDNEAVVKAADVRLSEVEQALLSDPRTGHLNRQGQDALMQAPAALEAYRAAQDRELAATADDDQHQMLRQLNERRLASFSTVVERHGAAERQRWHDEAGDRRIALMQADAALHWSDDALLRRALGTVRAEVREKAERHVWDSAQTESALRQQTSHTLVSAIEAAVERDPERAHSLRTRYDQNIEAADRAALDALLAEAQIRARAQRASAEILNTTAPDGQAPTLTWQLQQAEAIAEPAVRAATLRTLHAAAAAAEARARALAEQVLARVLKDGLTDPSQIPVREWVALDAERRQAIETRIDHNAAGTEPPPNPALVDELATQMTGAPSAFARRDLVPSVAQLPLPKWQRFRDLQAGIRRNDPATEDEVYAIKRGLQFATKMLPASMPDDSAANYRAELVEEIDTWRSINGQSPDDDAIAGILRRHLPTDSYVTRTLEDDPRHQPDIHLTQEAGVWGRNAWNALPKTVRGAVRLAPMLAIAPDDAAAIAALAGFTIALTASNGQIFYRNPETGQYITLNLDGSGIWVLYTALGVALGVFDWTVSQPVPRAALPPDLDETKTNLTGVPQPPTILPGPDIDAPQPPTILPGSDIDGPRLPTILKGPDTDAPRPPTILPGSDIDGPRLPTILKGPDIDAPQPPTIYESRSTDDHHNIPQFLWNPKRRSGLPPRYEFDPEVIKFFTGHITKIPKEVHWDLHDKYNAVAERAMQAYLKQAKANHETEQQFAKRMSVKQAQECIEYIIEYILNPPETKDPNEITANKGAREFLDNVAPYIKKPK